MKKIISAVLVLSMLFALSSCSLFEKEEPAETQTTASTETTNVAEESVLDKARMAYEAFFATTDADYPITYALVTDLDANDVPEVVISLGELGHITYILSYGVTSGLSVYSPIIHSSTPADVYISDNAPYLYFTDNGHNQSTAWYHEAVCFTATDEGFSNIMTYSGDEWKDTPDGIWQDQNLFNQYANQYDDAFEQQILAYVGVSKFENYFDICHSSDAEAYLERELSIDISAKRSEYERFRDTATQMIQLESGEDPDFVYVNDYDGNGTYEAFAFTGYDSTIDQVPAKTGEIWFVSNDEIVTLLKEGTFSSDLYNFECAFNTYFYAQELSAAGDKPLLWYVNENGCFEDDTFKGGAFTVLSPASINAASNSIIGKAVYNDTYVTSIVSSSSGNGKNTKNYYFFDSPDGIMEYGATVITESQFKTMGGDSYLTEIEEHGYHIKNILYRSNGLIHVNCYKTAANNQYYTTNITFKKTCSSVYPIDDSLNISDIDTELAQGVNGGFYLAASIEDIAIYPQ